MKIPIPSIEFPSTGFTSAELSSLRARIFSILDDCPSSAFSDQQFVDFYLSIYKLHSSKNENYMIHHSNLTEAEKTTVRRFLTDYDFADPSPADLPRIVSMDNVRQIHEGIVEYRIEVGPELSRVFEDNDDLAERICCRSIRLDYLFQQTYFQYNREEAGEDVWRYFTELTEKFNVVYREVNYLED